MTATALMSAEGIAGVTMAGIPRADQRVTTIFPNCRLDRVSDGSTGRPP
jgi:hypothetical protein